MAEFVSYVSVDMRADDDTDDYFRGDGKVSVSTTKLTFTDGDDTIIIRGSFDLAANNQISGGTITGIDAIDDGKLLGTFRKTSIDVSDLVNLPDSDTAVQRWVETVLFRGADKVTGSAYIDKLYGWNGNDTIKGLGGNDTLVGGSGNDRLTGGSGADQLTGSNGRDIFDFDYASQSGNSSAARDAITDFIRDTDKIDLSTIDARSNVAGNNTFSKFIAANAAFTASGQLKFANGILYANTDSDAAAELSIKLTGISTLSLSDIIV